jgi:hypothetical protein
MARNGQHDHDRGPSDVERNEKPSAVNPIGENTRRGTEDRAWPEAHEGGNGETLHPHPLVEQQCDQADPEDTVTDA